MRVTEFVALTALIACRGHAPSGVSTSDANVAARDSAPRTASPPAPRMVGPSEVTITSTDATHYQVDLDGVVQAALYGIHGDLALTPTADGYRIDDLPTTSVFARLGLLKGDTLVSFDSAPISGSDSLLGAYARMKKMRAVTLALARNGQPVAITYRLLSLDVGTVPPVPAQNDVSTVREDELDRGLHKSDETHYEIRRPLLARVLADQANVLRSARVVPEYQNGKLIGVKLFGIRPASVLSHLGLENGDSVRTINGNAINDPQSMLDAYTKAKGQHALTLELSRQGHPVTLTLAIVD